MWSWANIATNVQHIRVAKFYSTFTIFGNKMQHNHFATNRGSLSMKPESDLSITIFERINDNVLLVIKKNLYFSVTDS
jgi:hypothetical protein